ncbi:MAG: rane protein, partial [Flaviaesturariibacter sp.]|nr:rane protein [Flaviaesturariibacter sp.]
MNCRNLIKRLVLPALFLLTGFTVLAQNRTITGRVNDARGAGLVGVTVAVKGQNAATATNETGQFSINVPANATTLVFSSVGFGQQEFTLGASNTVTVTLSQLSGNLNEVVVVGYGTQRRKDLTASVATVSAKDFNKGLNTTPEQLIQGKVAGVQVTSNGGAPGSGSVIRIRGGASLSATNDPLIVIDGVPVSNNGIAGAANVLATINPNDIESFNILKDASATAIYGSRASNGVILITTKKGTRGDKLKISVSSLASLSKRTNQVDVLTGDEIRAYVNANGTAGQKALLGSSNTNWQDVVFRDAFSHEHTVSLSGGFKPLPYRFSVGYLDQEGILKTSNIQRTTGSLGLFPSLFDKHLNIIANLKATHTDNRFADEGAIGNAITFDPTQPVYQKNNYGGYFEWLDVTSGKPNTLSNRNPLALLDMRDDRSRVNRLIGNIQLDYKLHFFPDLRANLNLGYDYQEGNGRVMIPATAATQVTSANGAKGTGSRYNAENKNKVLEFFLNYAKELKNIRSRIDVTGGYSYQDFQYGGKNFAALDYFGDVIPNTTLPQYPNYFNQQTLLSYWGRFNMTFSEKYILSAIVRRDASSLFAKENRWGTFPAVSFAWRMKDEGFLKDVNALSDLKLRIGYGVTGQQDITGSAGYYPYIPGYFLGDSSSMYQFGSGFVQTYAPKAYNNRLKWEETETINLGLDFGFFKGRLNGSIEVFR